MSSYINTYQPYVKGCLNDWFHINSKQTLFYKCLTAFTIAFITALWSPSLILVLLFLLLVEILLCSVSVGCNQGFCILSRTGMLAFGLLGWICGRALSEHAIGVDDEPGCD